MNDKTWSLSARRTDSFGTCPLPRVRRGQQRGYIQTPAVAYHYESTFRYGTAPQNELFLVGCHAASSTCDLATKRPYRGSLSASHTDSKPLGACWMHVILEDTKHGDFRR
jgi:hypothetical protein